MSENLIQNILKEINKTGFPLEFKVADLLSQHSYYIAQSTYFIDREEDKSREIDIRAFSNRIVKYKGSDFCISNVLTIECKKTDNKPWVFLSSKFNENDPGISDLLFNTKKHVHFNDYIELELEKFHPFYQNPNRARSYFEAFKNESSEQIFKAVTSCVKATLYQQDILESMENRVSFYYPCIVFEGDLFEGVMLDGEIHLEPVEVVYLSFIYDSLIYKHQNFTVPIIKPSYLGEFIRSIEKTLEIAVDNLVEV